ncbi:endolysin [Pseudomonas phage Eisa9]|uniref:Endolysin n=1 Tax=Pseudomonas phage Eisa9 TaxID=2900148 RepID=A0AAE8YJ26_9CAUD|nr:endolysin [Pseudomonas phage Eisa9]
MGRLTTAARTSVVALVLSAAGIGFLQTEEGHSNRVYLDSIGKPTVCTGHMDAKMKVGTYYSPEQCDQLLREDTGSAAYAVRQLVKVPLYQYEFDALVSFCFNVGNANCRSATLFKVLNNGDYAAVPYQLSRWRFAGGLDCKVRSNNCYGVYLRRINEGTLWKEGYQ